MHLKKLKLVNFCVAILILKMEENKQHFGILFCVMSRKVKMQKKICVVHGEGAMADGTCQKWLAQLRAGDFLLDDVP